MRKGLWTVLCFVLLTGCVALSMGWGGHRGDRENSAVKQLEAAVGDEYEKQLEVKTVATVIYENENDTSKIIYRVLETTYCNGDADEPWVFHEEKFLLRFSAGEIRNSERKKIKGWDAVLYRCAEKSYLCWVCSPEVSCVLEYDPDSVGDEEIERMARSMKEAS